MKTNKVEGNSDGVDILWWLRMPWIWGYEAPWGKGET
jgi:hypothetical protein